MNHCATCKIELPDLDLICYSKYKRKDGTQGKSFHCRICAYKHTIGWRKSLKGKAYMSKLSTLYNKNNPKKHKARVKLNVSISRGKILKGKCDICGDVKTQAHHHDYSKPLDVKWLCRKHHYELHKYERLLQNK